jgi:hypothetical protein
VLDRAFFLGRALLFLVVMEREGKKLKVGQSPRQLNRSIRYRLKELQKCKERIPALIVDINEYTEMYDDLKRKRAAYKDALSTRDKKIDESSDDDDDAGFSSEEVEDELWERELKKLLEYNKEAKDYAHEMLHFKRGDLEREMERCAKLQRDLDKLQGKKE